VPPYNKGEKNMKNANLIYCCRSGESAAHISRALALAKELSDRFHVTVVLDDACSRAISIPTGIDPLILPTNDAAKRRSLMHDKVAAIAPSVIVVEDFPFFPHRSKGEILPLIQLVRSNAHEESLVISVADGVLATDCPDKENSSDIAADFLERYFDMVVVQSDPVFARLEEFFQPNNPLTTPIFHTGFVSPIGHNGRGTGEQDAGGILISAGDGYSGALLFRAAIEAQDILWHTLRLPMKIIAGRQLPEDEWQELKLLAEGSPTLTVTRTVTDMRTEVMNAQLSVSQCGYEATVNAIAARTPSLFVPQANCRYREELLRAQRLVYWGAGRLMMPQLLNGASLANEIHQFAKFERRDLSFDLNGAANAAQLIADVVYTNNYAADQWHPAADARPH